MSKDSIVELEDIPRIANDLSNKSLGNLFKNRSGTKDRVISKLVTNKRMNLP